MQMIDFKEKVCQSYEKGDYEAVKRWNFQRLVEAESKEDFPTIADCLKTMGNIAEIERRIGDAFRNWFQALWVYERCGKHYFSKTERIRDLIKRWHEFQKVFVSYAHKDKKKITPIIEYAQKNGINFEIDENFLAGRSIEMQIKQAIQNCPKFLVFYSRHYLKRSWTNFELGLFTRKYHEDRQAHAVDNCIVFFCLDKQMPADEFSNSLMIRIHEGFKRACDRLVSSLKNSAL